MKVKRIIEIDEDTLKFVQNLTDIIIPCRSGKTLQKNVIEAIKFSTPYNPKGEWYEYISKGLLKTRHGDYVIYKVDFLLDNLTREVYIMEGARRMKGGQA